MDTYIDSMIGKVYLQLSIVSRLECGKAPSCRCEDKMSVAVYERYSDYRSRREGSTHYTREASVVSYTGISWQDRVYTIYADVLSLSGLHGQRKRRWLGLSRRAEDGHNMRAMKAIDIDSRPLCLDGRALQLIAQSGGVP